MVDRSSVGGRHRNEVPGTVSPPRWDEAAEWEAFRAWLHTTEPEQRTPKAAYEWMAQRRRADLAAWAAYCSLREAEMLRDANWLRDQIRLGEREVERLRGLRG